MIEIVGIAVLVNMFTHWFTPIQKAKGWVVDRLPLWIGKLLVCSKCAGFWIGLIYFQSLPLAAITSLVSYLIDNMIYNIEIWKNKI